MDPTVIIVAALGSSVLGAVVGALASRRKTDAEAQKTLAEAYGAFAERLTQRVAGLEASLDRERTTVDQIRTRLGELELANMSLTSRVAELETENGQLREALRCEREKTTSQTREIARLEGRIAHLEAARV